jgi:hypothetical protein
MPSGPFPLHANPAQQPTQHRSRKFPTAIQSLLRFIIIPAAKSRNRYTTRMYAIALKITDAKRTILFCAATLLLHWGAIHWAGQGMTVPAPATGVASVNVRFVQAPTTLAAQALTSIPAPAPIRAKKDKPAKPSQLAQADKLSASAVPAAGVVATPDIVAETPAPPPMPADSPTDTKISADSSNANNSASASTSTSADTLANTKSDIGPETHSESTAPQQTPPAKTYRVQLPPSAELQYAVRKVDGKQENASPTTGRGKIRWINQGGRYRIEGDVSFLFFTLLNFQSEGELNTQGIAPVLYTEKRGTRSRTNTHFQRDNNIISFSASTRQFPRAEDAQDRASVLWQLAGIGRGDSANLDIASIIDIQVASEREAEAWHFFVSGVESITLEQGQLQVWRFTRVPRAGTYERRLDVWLSPAHNWSPVRIRDTEANGTYTEMSMTTFIPLQ